MAKAPIQTLDATGVYKLHTGGVGVGTDGIAFQFTEVGTQSLVLAKNVAPPGSAVSLQNIGYSNAAGVPQTAGTAITASGLAYVTLEDAQYDIWGTLTATSGYLLVTERPQDLTMEKIDVPGSVFGAPT